MTFVNHIFICTVEPQFSKFKIEFGKKLFLTIIASMIYKFCGMFNDFPSKLRVFKHEGILM